MLNIYCDESRHLENDGNNIMVLGSVKVPDIEKKEIYEEIRRIKEEHGLSTWFEIKWTKVSEGKLDFYIDLIDYFFKKSSLSFRAVVATNKKTLNHEKYNNGDYDEWYYKMYYLLLDTTTPPINEYRIFIDIKDTRGGAKVKKLQEVLCNNKWDFNREIIKDIKQVHSNESELLQLCDLFIGALSFYHRGLYDSGTGSKAKKKIVEEIIKYSGTTLTNSTIKSKSKFNLFIWNPRKRGY